MEGRDALARERLVRVLGRHGIANARTLEQKISDAGPYNQRIDPHALTPPRNALVKEGQITRLQKHNAPWFHLTCFQARSQLSRTSTWSNNESPHEHAFSARFPWPCKAPPDGFNTVAE